MQSSTGQYSTQAGDPAHPVQHSVMTANSFGFFFRGVRSPLDLGSNLNSSGTIPAGFKESASAGMARLYRSACGFHPTQRQEPQFRLRKNLRSSGFLKGHCFSAVSHSDLMTARLE